MKKLWAWLFGGRKNKQENTPVKTSPDFGKCTKCKFYTNIHCAVGTHYAEKGLSRICFEGELWEPGNKI